MKPLFPFYGSKWRDARRYGKPRHDLVIEPFAGSAGYATYWTPPKVHLYDVDPIIVGVWQYLIRVTPAEVLRLPDLAAGESVDDLPRLPQEARWLIGFWLNRGSAQPKKTKTAFSARTERQQLVWSARARERIAQDIVHVRNWRVTLRSYAAIAPERATWFVDPPYVDKGKCYRYKTVDYAALGAWCRTLPGDVFVCEQDGASWLPFSTLAEIKSTRGTSKEVVWRNEQAI